MTKTEVKKGLQAEIPSGQGVVDLVTISKFMGQKNMQRFRRKYLNDLERFDGKFYLLDDVATALAERWR